MSRRKQSLASEPAETVPDELLERVSAGWSLPYLGILAAGTAIYAATTAPGDFYTMGRVYRFAKKQGATDLQAGVESLMWRNEGLDPARACLEARYKHKRRQDPACE